MIEFGIYSGPLLYTLDERLAVLRKKILHWPYGWPWIATMTLISFSPGTGAVASMSSGADYFVDPAHSLPLQYCLIAGSMVAIDLAVMSGYMAIGFRIFRPLQGDLWRRRIDGWLPLLDRLRPLWRKFRAPRSLARLRLADFGFL